MNILLGKLKEVSFSVIPISLLVLIVHFLIAPLHVDVLQRFLIGSILVILGLGIFLFGAELGIGTIGNLMGRFVVQTNKKRWVILGCLVVGFFITFAEPSLNILAKQVYDASGGILSNQLIVICVSISVGLMISISVLRVLFSKKISNVYLLFYGLVLIFGLMISEEILAISMDSGGASTGAMTTPFILALGYGVAQYRGGRKLEEDAFGHVGLASVGPMLAVMTLTLVTRLKGIDGHLDPFIPLTGIWSPFIEGIGSTLYDTALTIGPLTILFIVMNFMKFKLETAKFYKVLKGLGYTFIGLFLFFLGVNTGFMEAGRMMGFALGSLDSRWLLPLIGFILGMVVVLAEPAVYVLTQQIEAVTSGHIKRRIILVFLSIGIALAVMISMFRIMIPGLKLWHILLPGYLVGMILSRNVSELFVGIGFDAGSVASGPMTVTFIFAFAQGAAEAIDGAHVLIDGFGIIAVIALMPVVALQILGYIYGKKEKESERVDHGGSN